MVLSPSCSPTMLGAKPLLPAHAGAPRRRWDVLSLSPQVSLFLLCVPTQPGAGADESWGTKGMCLRPWLSESQGNIRIQCFLEERGRGGGMHLMTGLQCSKPEQGWGCSRVCGAIIHLACSTSRRTDDIWKENAWSHTCLWADQVSTSPVPCKAPFNLAHTLSLRPFGSIIQTGEKNQTCDIPQGQSTSHTTVQCHSQQIKSWQRSSYPSQSAMHSSTPDGGIGCSRFLPNGSHSTSATASPATESGHAALATAPQVTSEL